MPLLYSHQDDHSVWAQITRGRTLFYLKASWTEANRESFIRQLNNGEYSQDPITDLVLSYCMPVLERIAPETTVRGLTLEDFLHAPTLHLEVIHDEQGIRITGQDDRSEEEISYDLDPKPTSELRISTLSTIPHINASEIMLAPSREDLEDLRGLNGTVTTASGELMYFKARESGRGGELDRELEILCRLKSLRTNGLSLRVPELRGIVVSDSGQHGEMMLGILLTLITPHALGMHPLEKGFCGRFELHKRWKDQVTAAVQELHNRDIVWGDVNPCNIIIDHNLNAWVIDFGGNFNAEFVDKENAETKRGDWQGIERLFEDWLPSRRIWPSGEVGEESTAELY